MKSKKGRYTLTFRRGSDPHPKHDAHTKGSRRYRTMESAATRLQKEAKGYLDSLRGEEKRRTFETRRSFADDRWGYSHDRVPNANSGND